MTFPKQLTFSSFTISEGSYNFTYDIDGEEYTLQLRHSQPTSLSPENLEVVLFNLGMCYLLDIAEIVIPQNIHVNFSLKPLQLHFWETTFTELAREKMCVYSLDLSLLKPQWTTNEQGRKFERFSLSGQREKVALCLTGGKESLSLFKLLKDKVELNLFFLNLENNPYRLEVYEKVKDDFPTVRTHSNRKELFATLTQKFGTSYASTLDMGHLVLNTLIHGDQNKYVLIGNEYSANFPNLVYQAQMVNHQFVKTFAFAQKLNNYLHEFITNDYSYFSPFFGMYEYKISSFLFKDDEYLDIWTSCNQVKADKKFCCDCPKCAFSYLLAAVHRDRDTEIFLSKFFSENLLNRLDMFHPLMDFTSDKPLECVGDKKEVWVALSKLMQKPEFATTKAVSYFADHILPLIEKDLASFEKEVDTVHTVDQMLPEELTFITQ